MTPIAYDGSSLGWSFFRFGLTQRVLWLSCQALDLYAKGHGFNPELGHGVEQILL